jgi:hypothetical protein
MVSYFKTQWFKIIVGLADLGLSLYYTIQGEGITALCWFIFGIVMLIMSRVFYNDDRIELLEKEKERNDAMYELVQELVLANKIDREIAKKYEARLKKLEDKK